MSNKTEHAFPIPENLVGTSRIEADNKGITTRDYFAAAALPALVARFEGMHGAQLDRIAKDAYAIADAMIVARKR
ncbi:hypothetical protein [Burkholderia gladioli]|uniref:hypothetical protein n=1 Tax=Burkholderia gladioli TaxID=28095 RepID=UPI001ABBA77B|nr:hypothetical protein [Burkholderia gladioli]MBU9153134.1 hypothetical protein [Burkholderia gladioli]MDN7812103.1 hypothetical protein [Burkholderia gladioli]